MEFEQNTVPAVAVCGNNLQDSCRLEHKLEFWVCSVSKAELAPAIPGPTAICKAGRSAASPENNSPQPGGWYTVSWYALAEFRPLFCTYAHFPLHLGHLAWCGFLSCGGSLVPPPPCSARCSLAPHSSALFS